MQPLSRSLSFAAVGVLALTVVSIPGYADEFGQNLGPVLPYDAILTTFGNKRVIAFYEPDNGHCAVNAVVWDKTDAETGNTSAARVRVSLNPRQIVHIDSKSINLECGDHAGMLTLVGTSKFVTAGTAQ